MESRKALRERATRIVEIVARWYAKDIHCALDHQNPLQLLVATMLAAQCTDERVNQVTPGLFERYPDALALAESVPEELEEAIRPTGFFRNKAKSIRACCTALVDRHGGEVPPTMKELKALPGVGRKTANVVLTRCFGVPGVVVDTHVLRLSRRLGLSFEKNADKVESDLMKLVPEDQWGDFSHRLTWHGRRVCNARKPRCDECRLRPDCPEGRKLTAQARSKP
ncbi:MAG: endonuclease III [Deltaproteobacteria bacterium]|nr:endonuclease III [Deltaproteobacteria bacterium]